MYRPDATLDDTSPDGNLGLDEEEQQEEQQEESQMMTPEEVRSALKGMIQDAVAYASSELSERRAKAERFYKGELFGDEVENRSKVVVTALRDTVLQMMPSFMRVFFGAEKPVEFVPRTKEAILKAEMATRYIGDVVVRQDNRGFTEVYAWVKDALVKRTGVVKWWWDDGREARGFEATIDAQALQVMQADEDITITSTEPSEFAPRDLFTVQYTQRRSSGRARFACLPPEEYIYSRKSRTTASDAYAAGVAPLVAHRTQLTGSQLVAMGIDEEVIELHGGRSSDLDSNAEELERRSTNGDTTAPEVGEDPSLKQHEYTEAYAYLDVDGDGIGELRKFCCLGADYFVVNGDELGEMTSERPFAVMCPDPEPHVVEGQGISDYTEDLQVIESMVLRSTLDSLALSLISRFAYSEGDVNLDDLNNPALGSSIRVRQGSVPSQVLQEFTHSFVGREGLGVLQFLREMREGRTGTSKAVGLDSDVMQSTTKAAVAATVSSAQERIELIARIFCETGFRELYRGLLRLTVAHPDEERMMKVAGMYAAVDPNEWEADMDVAVNVGVGGGLREEKDAIFQASIAKQEQMLQMLGPTPIVDFKRYRDTLVKWLQNAGRMDADQIFGEVPEGWDPNAGKQPPPDPNLLIAQAELQKAQSKVQSDAAKVQLDAQKAQVDLQREMRDLDLKQKEMELTDAREREKIEADIALRIREMNYKYNAQVTIENIKADVAREQRNPGVRKIKVKRDDEGKTNEMTIEHSMTGGE